MVWYIKFCERKRKKPLPFGQKSSWFNEKQKKCKKSTVFKSYSHKTQKVDCELQSSEFIRAKGEKIMYLES